MTDKNKPTLPESYRKPTFGEALQSLTAAAESMDPSAVFLVAVWEELERARLLFPSPDGTMAALAEETGELAKALLGEELTRVGKEAMQVAVVALRVAVEGDPTLDAHRTLRGLEPSRDAGKKRLHFVKR